jgi:hypothetical protein
MIFLSNRVASLLREPRFASGDGGLASAAIHLLRVIFWAMIVNMSILGHVQNGVIVLDGNQTLPEGVAVVISFPVPPADISDQPAGNLQDKNIDIFAEMRGLMVDVPHVDDSRQAIYLRAVGSYPTEHGPAHAPFPLVHSARSGSVDLTNNRIAEILNEEDAAS